MKSTKNKKRNTSFNINQMIKLGKVNLAILISLALLAFSMGPGRVVMAATDPDGRTIIEDNAPLNTSKQTTDDNGHVIINEPDIRQTPQEIQERKDAETRQNIIELAVVIAIIAIGLVVYLNKGRFLKKKKYSRKK